MKKCVDDPIFAASLMETAEKSREIKIEFALVLEALEDFGESVLSDVECPEYKTTFINVAKTYGVSNLSELEEGDTSKKESTANSQSGMTQPSQLFPSSAKKTNV